MTDRTSRTLGVLLALVPWGFSGVFFLGSLFWGLGLRCDESCGDAGDWRRTEDAWQWEVLPVLGGLTFIAGTALVVCVWRAHARGAFAALVIGTGLALATGTWFEPGWREHVDRNSQSVVICVLVFSAGVGAALISRAPRKT
jgi:UDP-N-acetylmuramyl pentapeptide phosphotransferase/UDP-N-acetylglucosamine-1-phosphate transferase